MEIPIKKKRGMPKGGWPKKDLVDKILDGDIKPDKITIGFEPEIKEIIVEKIVEKIIEVPKKELKGFALYKKLKDLRYPQGGMGRWVEDPNSTEKVYIPRPEELYTQFIGDPSQWQELQDTLARVWIELSIKR